MDNQKLTVYMIAYYLGRRKAETEIRKIEKMERKQKGYIGVDKG